jgi:hypothetical protein
MLKIIAQMRESKRLATLNKWKKHPEGFQEKPVDRNSFSLKDCTVDLIDFALYGGGGVVGDVHKDVGVCSGGGGGLPVAVASKPAACGSRGRSNVAVSMP